MTLRSLYRAAAFAKHRHDLVVARLNILSRGLVLRSEFNIGTVKEQEDYCLTARRAMRVCRERQHEAIVTRNEARSQMLFDPCEIEEERKAAAQINEIALRHAQIIRKARS